MSLEAAPPNAVLVVGSFDMLGLEHIRALEALRGRTSAAIVAAVIPRPNRASQQVLSQRARAEMAAALRMLDYVLITAEPGKSGDLQDSITRLRPAEIISLDETDERRMRRLMARVQDGQIR